MTQLCLFDEDLVEEVRKQVLKEFWRIDGEDYDEWLDFIRFEVDYRLKELRKNKPHPQYKKDIDISKKTL